MPNEKDGTDNTKDTQKKVIVKHTDTSKTEGIKTDAEVKIQQLELARDKLQKMLDERDEADKNAKDEADKNAKDTKNTDEADKVNERMDKITDDINKIKDIFHTLAEKPQIASRTEIKKALEGWF